MPSSSPRRVRFRRSSAELPQGHILFIPDKNLGRYIARQVPEKRFILNEGFCPVHQGLDLEEVHLLRRDHPFAELLAHPECTEAVLAEADFIGSTKQIIERIVASARKEFIVLTEADVISLLSPVPTFSSPILTTATSRLPD